MITIKNQNWDSEGSLIGEEIINLDTPNKVNLYWGNAGVDYKTAKEECILLCQTYDPYVSNFPFASNADNYAAIKYMSVLDANKDFDSAAVITFLMGEGYSLDDAKTYILDAGETDHDNSVACMDGRWKKGKRVAMAFLSRDDQTNFAKSTATLVDAMLKYAILGRNYRDKDDGIMDYIEDTNEWALQGLRSKNYTVAGVPFSDPAYDATFEVFKTALIDALINNKLTV